ncbi:putative ATP-dependent endonuclease of OLD family [Actinomadura pelletieri DSM 43383]|uniref:Putative ATP-dependent endonuclease of OLD family n=1 Tax=Actinomadura pelletieri DSM 43383 TaxID=1120940 RepID=A0A495QZS2_9ACTN|nr:AAA family ATPase [Actinomadura pelletieri]RKS79356.1 putative ATP-dependent endonuclease of OLD family [Actinomadura pelletieri DSM 43383]
MQLESFNVQGFRSLSSVSGIPVLSPTIITGHNDGGKSATLTAAGFLLGANDATENDLTFSIAEDGSASRTERETEVCVEGTFILSDAERAELGLPAHVRIRRTFSPEVGSKLEIYREVPEDARLRELPKLRVPELKALNAEFGLDVRGLRADLLKRLEEYAARGPKVLEWVQVEPTVKRRMPQFLYFGGLIPDADETIRAALHSRYRTHLQDENLQGRISELENTLSEKLRGDAEDLCTHVRERCPDLIGAEVRPEVSFQAGLKRTELILSQVEGEDVSLASTGSGRARRVALAVWEWTNDILRQQEEAHTTEETKDDSPNLLVAYDEPDTHLDYVHQRRVMDLIRSQCKLSHIQVLVATHSLNLIDGVDISNIVHLRLLEQRTSMERLEDAGDPDIHLGNIASALGVRNSVLLHERCFVGVEGPTEQQVLPLLFRLSEQMHLQSAGIALWACNNNEGALHFTRFLLKHGRTAMLAVDADSKTRPRGLFTPDKLARFGIDPGKDVTWLGNPNEIEELFSGEQWAKAANLLWKRVDGASWKASDFNQLRNEKKFSQKVFDMVRERSQAAPGGKPEMLYQLAKTLQCPEDVPLQLRQLFASLIKLAND